MARTDSTALPGAIDIPHVVRGASVAFTVLVFGGFLSPALTLVSPLAAQIALTATSVLAFHLAARKPGRALFPAVHGATAALLGYLLVLPLVLAAPAGRDFRQVLLTVGTAIGVGALTAVLHARTKVHS
jgi:hypothetical protein